MASFSRSFKAFARSSARLQGRNIAKNKLFSSSALQGKYLSQERLQGWQSLASVATLRFSTPSASRVMTAGVLRLGNMCSNSLVAAGDFGDVESCSSDDEGLLVISESESVEEL